MISRNVDVVEIVAVIVVVVVAIAVDTMTMGIAIGHIVAVTIVVGIIAVLTVVVGGTTIAELLSWPVELHQATHHNTVYLVQDQLIWSVSKIQ